MDGWMDGINVCCTRSGKGGRVKRWKRTDSDEIW